MFDRIFGQSSGRVVAIARLSLAAIFLFATLMGSSVWRTPPNELVLAAYFAFAAVVVFLVWNNWWVDARIAAATHLADILFFATVLLWPEGYASPYFVFFVFLLLSATIRWGWRATAATAAVVVLLYLVAGLLVAEPRGPHFELQRFIIRSGHVVVLSAILIWFGLRRRFSSGFLLPVSSADFTEEAESPLHAALRHSLGVLNAGSALAFWTNANGECMMLSATRQGVNREDMSDGAATPLDRHAFLFSVPKNRALLSPEAPRPHFRFASQLLNPQILRMLQTHEGLALPVHSDVGQGLFLFWSIDALHSDHLQLGHQLSRQLTQLIEHAALISARQDGAIARERMSLARDLHDGVVQFLAGSTYRIEAISRSASDGRDVAADLQDLKELMLLEQEDLRTSIAALRTDSVSLSQVAADARALCSRLARHWQLNCNFSADVPDVPVSTRLHRDVLQIIREAVANAARHSSARKVEISLEARVDAVALTIGNDGGASSDLPADGPWSIRERVQHAGGTISTDSDKDGTKLSVRLPITRERK